LRNYWIDAHIVRKRRHLISVRVRRHPCEMNFYPSTP